jgi:hypothetical protein
MCIAILRVKYRVKETVTVDCDTEDTLNERLVALENNDEVVEYRVFRSSGKRVRVTAWEDRA